MYDLDESGYISKEEMTKILESFYKLIGPSDDNPLATFSGKKYDAPQQLVDEIFEQMDVSGDGKISLAEYQEGAIKNPDIIQGLKLFSESWADLEKCKINAGHLRDVLYLFSCYSGISLVFFKPNAPRPPSPKTIKQQV